MKVAFFIFILLLVVGSVFFVIKYNDNSNAREAAKILESIHELKKWDCYNSGPHEGHI